MKITRKQLRRLIAEAAKTIIVDPEGVATPSDVAFASGRAKDQRIAGSHPKLGSLMRQGRADPGVGQVGAPYRKQGRELAGALGLEEPLTPAEETAVDSMGYYAEVQDSNEVEYLYDMDYIINLVKRGKAGRHALKTIGADYVEDIWPDGDYDEESRADLQHVANILGCEIHELGFIPMERDDRVPLFHQLLEFLYRNVKLKNKNIKSRTVQNMYGNSTMLLYNYNGVEFLYDAAFGGFSTLYFCSK